MNRGIPTGLYLNFDYDCPHKATNAELNKVQEELEFEIDDLQNHLEIVIKEKDRRAASKQVDEKWQNVFKKKLFVFSKKNKIPTKICEKIYREINTDLILPTLNITTKSKMQIKFGTWEEEFLTRKEINVNIGPRDFQFDLKGKLLGCATSLANPNDFK